MPKKKTTKNKLKPLTWDDVSKWPLLQNPIRPLLDLEAMTPSFLVNKLKDELEAMETKPFKSTTKEFEDGDLMRIIDKVIYSKPLIALDIRQKARQDAMRYVGMEPAEQHAFPDKEGNPQDISVLPSLEAANRLAFLLEQAVKRKKAGKPKDDRTSSPKDK